MNSSTRYNKFKKWSIIALVSCITIISISIFVIDRSIVNSTNSRIYSNVKDLPKNKVGLLLGTAKFMDKARQIVNPYYQNRIDVAVELYMSGKVDYLIVSGDSSSLYYNEPKTMKDDLIARGIPAIKILMDNLGFRTLESILRCKEVYNQTKFTIISQKFHDQRAIYLANHSNLDCVAIIAEDGDKVFEVFTREKLARVKMMIDIFTGLKLKHPVEKVNIN